MSASSSSSRGPQSLRGSPGSSSDVRAGGGGVVDGKLHALPLPQRQQITQIIPGADDAGASAGAGIGGAVASSSSSSSWDSSEVARQLALLTEERNFLRKYVARCEQELKAYQLQYPDLVGGQKLGAGAGGDMLNELSGGIEELPPWIGQAKYMSPLLVAYEARIEELTEKNQEQLHDFATLKQQYDELYKRNAQVEAELESNIKTLLSNMDQQKGKGVGAGALDEDEVNELQEQVKLYKEQLDIVNSQKLELEQELGKLHKSLADARLERDTYWSGELKKLQSSLSALRLERDKFKASSSTLGQTQIDLSALQKEHQNLQKKYMNTQIQLEALEKDLENSLEKEKNAQSKLVNAERDLESLFQTLQSMEKESEQNRAASLQTIKRESDTIARMEAMKLERDNALLRETNLQKEVSRLEERLQFELSQAHQKHDEDLASMYEKSRASEGKLAEEIQNLAILLAENEAAREKTAREALQWKAQSERLSQSSQADLSELKSQIGRLQQERSEQSHAVEEYKARTARAETESQRNGEFAQKESQQMQGVIQNLKLKNETLTLSNQSLHYASQRTEMALGKAERETQELRQQSEQALVKLNAQLIEVETQRKLQVDELKMRLEEAYRLHEQSESRAQELNASVDIMVDKWRKENQSIRSHLGKQLTEEKTQNTTLLTRIAELDQLKTQLVRERDQALAYQKANADLQTYHAQVTENLKTRNEVLEKELQQYLAREPEYTAQIKSLQTKLDRAEIESKRLQRSADQARKKSEFLEHQQYQQNPASIPLQNNSQILNQQGTAAGAGYLGSNEVSSGGVHGGFPASLYPPNYKK